MSDSDPAKDQPASPPLTPAGEIPGYYKCAMFGMAMPILIMVASPILRPFFASDEQALRVLPWIFCAIVAFGAWLSAKGLIGGIRARDFKARLRGAVGLAANLVWFVIIVVMVLARR